MTDVAQDPAGLLTLDPVTIADPYPLYRRLRDADGPVREPTHGVWLVARYDDIVAVVRDTDTFSSVKAPAGPPPDLGGVPDEVVARLRSAPPPPRTLVTADPPDHTRYRTVVNRFLNARVVKGWEPRIREIADELVDAFADRGRCDLVADFAGPLPLRVVAELLGMAPADHDDLRRWADESAHGIGNPQVVTQRLRSGAPGGGGSGFADYFADRIEDRRRHPVEGDLVSDLAHARTDDGERLTDTELLSILGHFLVAGHETSTKMIATGMLLLCDHPDQMAAVRADRSLCAGLIEESLRFDAPVQGMFRVATTDTELAGQRIDAGDMLMVLWASGNHDAGQFPEPERFDVTRRNARTNLAFGQGVHYCAGAPFARAEGRIGFEVLLERLDDIRLAVDPDELERPPSFILRGLSALPLQFSRSEHP